MRGGAARPGERGLRRVGDHSGSRAIRSASSALAAPGGAGPPRGAGRAPCGAGRERVAAAEAARRSPIGAAWAGQAQEPRRLPGALGLGLGSVFPVGPSPSVGAVEADGGSAVVGSGRGEPGAAAWGGGRGGRRRPSRLGELSWAGLGSRRGGAGGGALLGPLPAPGFVCGPFRSLAGFFGCFFLPPPFFFVCFFLPLSGLRGLAHVVLEVSMRFVSPV